MQHIELTGVVRGNMDGRQRQHTASVAGNRSGLTYHCQVVLTEGTRVLKVGRFTVRTTDEDQLPSDDEFQKGLTSAFRNMGGSWGLWTDIVPSLTLKYSC